MSPDKSIILILIVRLDCVNPDCTVRKMGKLLKLFKWELAEELESKGG
jgi:hypothetical protein